MQTGPASCIICGKGDGVQLHLCAACDVALCSECDSVVHASTKFAKHIRTLARESPAADKAPVQV